MSWVWDILTVALFAFMLWKAWKDGFFKTLMHLISWVLALVLAIALATPVATWIFDTFIRGNMTAEIANQLESTSGIESFLSAWDAKLLEFPEAVQSFLQSGGMGSSDAILGSLLAEGTDFEVATQLVDTIIAPLAILLISLVCMILLFVLLSFLLSIVVKLIGNVFKLPLLKQLDKTLGLVLGAVQGVIAAGVFAFLIHSMCNANLIDGVLTTAVYESTYVVKAVAESLSFLKVQGVPLSELADFTGLMNVFS